MLTGYLRAELPAPGTAGRVVRVTDSVRGVWMDQGTQWFNLTGEVINVQEFGATGDGTTNDAVAIQAAIDVAESIEGGVVLFPPPEVDYFVGTTTLTLDGSRAVTLKGSGWAGDNGTIGCVIRGSSTNAVIYISDVSQGADGIYIDDLCVRNTGTGYALKASVTNSAHAVSNIRGFRSCFMNTGTAGAVLLEGTVRVSFWSCLLRATSGGTTKTLTTAYGAASYRPTTLELIDTTIKGQDYAATGGIGAYLDHLGGCRMVACTIEQAGTCLQTSTGYDLAILGNHFESLGTHIHVNAAADDPFGVDCFIGNTLPNIGTALTETVVRPDITFLSNHRIANRIGDLQNINSGNTSLTLESTIADAGLLIHRNVGGSQSSWLLATDSTDVFRVAQSGVGNKLILTPTSLKGVSGLVFDAGAGGLKVDVVAAGSLPGGSAAMDGRVLIEDNGAGDRNLVLYAGGQRFRLDPGDPA